MIFASEELNMYAEFAHLDLKRNYVCKLKHLFVQKLPLVETQMSLLTYLYFIASLKL